MARRFAKNYAVALLARKPENYEPLVKEINDAGGKAIGISTDTADGKSIQNAFDQINKERGNAPLAAAIFNVGGGFVRKPFLELSVQEYESGWQANGCVQYHIDPSAFADRPPDWVDFTSHGLSSHSFLKPWIKRNILPL